MNNLSSTELKKLIHDCQIDGNHRLANTLSELLALREAGKEPVAATMFKPVADLYEMQFADGSTMAFHTDAEKAVQWLNTCDGNKVQEYVTLERFQKAYAAPQLPAVPEYPELLPCPVLLEPGLRLGVGIKTSTLLEALSRRAEYYGRLEAMTPEEREEHRAGIEAFKSLMDGAIAAAPKPE